MSQPFSPSQLRAARALLDWSRADLAKHTGVSEPTIHRLENGIGKAEAKTQAKIRRIFEGKGIEFIEKIGVQWRQHHSRTLKGAEGLCAFYDDVYAEIQNAENKNIVICGTDEKYQELRMGQYLFFHRDRMLSYKKFHMRCLIEESDKYTVAPYCHYRGLAKQFYSNTPFYVYANKVAIIVPYGEDDPHITILNNKSIAEAYRNQFEAMWSLGREASKRKS